MNIREAIRRPPAGNRRVLNTAADWLLRLQNEDMSLEEMAQWQRWLEAHPDNRTAFDRMQDMWSVMEALPNKQPPALPVPAPAYRYYATAAALLLGVAILIATHLWNQRTTLGAAGAPAMTAFDTAGGQHRSVTLGDGSHLALGAKSLVWVRYVANEREVILDRGEAFFEVAKDPNRPFRVHAGTATITAVGTAFNVRRSGELVEVAVSEGSVKVDHELPVSSARHSQKIQDAPVRAGFEASIDTSSPEIAAVRAVSADTMGSWRNGRLEYLDKPLKFVIEDVNRYAARPIIIGDPAVGELRLTGTVFERDIDSWLRSVADLLPVKVERDATGIVVLRSEMPSERAGPRL